MLMIPAATAVALVKVGAEAARRAADTPTGQRLLQQGADLAKKAVNSKVFHDGSGKILQTTIESTGVHPNAAKAVAMAINDLALRGEDKAFRPAVAEQASRGAQAVGRLLGK